jgi:adenosylcobinamide-GDP ribazoletransferase
MNRMVIRAISLALVLLTRIPVPIRFEPEPKDWGRSVFFFPFVGLAIGAAMAGLYGLFPAADSGVLAVVLLTVWTLATGGLHLDGLGDTADAWIGGHGDRDKTLTIMKDPRCGPAAVVAITLVMLAKFTTLRVALQGDAWELLLWTPVLGRAAVVLMLLTSAYARPGGMGAIYAEHLPRPACAALVLGVVSGVALSLAWQGVVVVALLGVGFLFLRALLIARLGGITGDTLGASCELTETAALVLFTLLGT